MAPVGPKTPDLVGLRLPYSSTTRGQYQLAAKALGMVDQRDSDATIELLQSSPITDAVLAKESWRGRPWVHRLPAGPWDMQQLEWLSTTALAVRLPPPLNVTQQARAIAHIPCGFGTRACRISPSCRSN